MKKSLTSILSLSSTTFIVCPVTGIPLSVSFPNCGFDFHYTSPLAKFSNIQKVLELPSTKLYSLPKVILSGITLSLLSHHHLISNHSLTAAEANTYFQLIPSSTLVAAIKFFASPISAAMIEVLPKLSIDSIRDKVEFSTETDLLNNYLLSCKEIVNPTPVQSINIISTSTPVKSKIIEVKTITPEIRKEAKEVLHHLYQDELASPKLLSILKIVVQKDNLVTLADDMRDKLIARLEPLATSHSKRMIEILLSCKKNQHLSEQIKKSLISDDLSRVSDDFAIVKTRKSLAEILASKTMPKANTST